MKNESTITEINRIHVLMGTQLIMEGGTLFWRRMATEIIEAIGRTLDGQTDDIQRLLTRNSLIKLESATTEKEIRKLIMELIEGSDELSKIIVPKILGVLTELEKKSISYFKKDLAKRIKSNLVVESEVPSLIENFIKNKLTDNMKLVRNYIQDDIMKSANIAIDEFKNLTYLRAFGKGLRSSTGAGLFTKKVILRNIPIPYLHSKLRRSIQPLTVTESEIVKRWFWTGVGNYKQVKEIYDKHGIPSALLNMSGQIFRKWIFWTGVITTANILKEKVPGLFGEQVHKKPLDAFRTALIDHFQSASIEHVTPWVAIINYIINPFLQEGSLKEPKDNLIKYLNKLIYDSENNVKELENSVKTVKKKAIDKIDTVVDNINESKLGFQFWCEKTKREFKDYNEQTNIGTTTEGNKELYWEFDNGTFVELKPEM